MIADIAVGAATSVAAECKAVASNSKFHVEAVQVDITKEDSVRRLFDRMTQVFSRMDYCVNCVGVSKISLPHSRWMWRGLMLNCPDRGRKGG